MTSRKIDIIEAIQQGDEAVVHTLLCGGLDPNLLYKGQTALMQACESGYPNIAEMLIGNGAHIDTVDRYGRSALHFAARYGQLECCKVLIGANARDDLRAALLGNETPLEMARAKSHLDVVKLLLFGQQDIRPQGAEKDYGRKKEEATVQYGDRSIASGGASGATYAGRYTSQDAVPAAAIEAFPAPLPPPFAAQPMPVKDETGRLAPQPKYGY